MPRNVPQAIRELATECPSASSLLETIADTIDKDTEFSESPYHLLLRKALDCLVRAARIRSSMNARRLDS